MGEDYLYPTKIGAKMLKVKFENPDHSANFIHLLSYHLQFQLTIEQAQGIAEKMISEIIENDKLATLTRKGVYSLVQGISKLKLKDRQALFYKLEPYILKALPTIPINQINQVLICYVKNGSGTASFLNILLAMNKYQ